MLESMMGLDLLDTTQRTGALPPPSPPRGEERRRDPNGTEYTKDPALPYVPSDSQRREVADRLLIKALEDDTCESTHEHRDGCVRIKSTVGVFAAYCRDFGECGDTSCGCYRLKQPSGRKRFRSLVAQRTDEAIRADTALMHAGQELPGVRLVTIGSGGLLTDFEILLDLWSRGLRIESICAIDTAYKKTDNVEERALSALAIFFAPAKVFSFSSSDDYAAACAAMPHLYGHANVFVYCDAGAVPHEAWTKCACAALLPGYRAFELVNAGRHSSRRKSALDEYLPERLQHRHTTVGCSTMRSVRFKPGGGGWGGGSGSSGNRGSSSQLEDVDDPLIRQEERAQPHSLYVEAVEHLKKTAKQRAEVNPHLRMFRIVFEGTPEQKRLNQPGRMPVRAEPSRTATIAGARAKGDEILVDEVREDGWVRFSELDTYCGYEAAPHASEHAASEEVRKPKEMWMLIRADDVGQLLEEIALDGSGKEVNDEWMPSLM